MQLLHKKPPTVYCLHPILKRLTLDIRILYVRAQQSLTLLYCWNSEMNGNSSAFSFRFVLSPTLCGGGRGGDFVSKKIWIQNKFFCKHFSFGILGKLHHGIYFSNLLQSISTAKNDTKDQYSLKILLRIHYQSMCQAMQCKCLTKSVHLKNKEFG